MDAIEKLRRVVLDTIKANVPVQTVWATCSSVDAEQMTMEAKRDGLELYDVLLGIGDDLVLPAEGARVLLGLIENKATAYWLIWAESYDKRNIHGDGHGGLVIADKVTERMRAVEDDLNALKQAFASWLPVPNDGGAALKTSTSTWAGQQLEPTVSSDLQNSTVNHG